MRLLRLILGAGALAAMAPAAGPVVQIWTSGEIKRVGAELAPAAEAKGLEGKPLGAYGNHSTAVWRRTRSGQAELHRTKVDLLIIEDGEATLLYGGTIPDGKNTSPVEIRGAAIRGGESLPLRAGDVVRVPAGVPHQFILAKGQSVSYFAIKIAR
jgi:mannose-6-phosphate isomerase-like protein (cupin superfamily)